MSSVLPARSGPAHLLPSGGWQIGECRNPGPAIPSSLEAGLAVYAHLVGVVCFGVLHCVGVPAGRVGVITGEFRCAP